MKTVARRAAVLGSSCLVLLAMSLPASASERAALDTQAKQRLSALELGDSLTTSAFDLYRNIADMADTGLSRGEFERVWTKKVLPQFGQSLDANQLQELQRVLGAPMDRRAEIDRTQASLKQRLLDLQVDETVIGNVLLNVESAAPEAALMLQSGESQVVIDKMFGKIVTSLQESGLLSSDAQALRELFASRVDAEFGTLRQSGASAGGVRVAPTRTLRR